MKNRSTWFLITTIVPPAALVLAVSSPSAAQDVTLHYLSVRRDTSTTFTDANMDAAFNDAFDGTYTDDGANDITCLHGFDRANFMTTFPNPPNWDCTVIGSQAEMTACMGQPGFVKIVTTINYCGGIGTWAGCAPRPGNTMVLQRAAALGTARGPLTNHEFGHATGLPHREGIANLIMNAGISSASRKLDATECTSLRSNNVQAGGPPAPGGMLGGTLLASEDGQTQDFSNVPIADLGRTLIVDAMPFEAANYYGQADVQILLSMLKDPTEADYHGTIAALVGIISNGSESDAQALIDFANQRQGEDPHRSSAAIGLGYLANRGSAKAMEFLIAASVGSDQSLAETATLGLAVSGKPEALGKLQQLRSAASGTRATELDEAISNHQTVVGLGLRGYYGR